MTGYVVVAGYVTVETAVPGGRAHVDIPHGTVLPGDVPVEQVETELRAGRITPVVPVVPAAAVVVEPVRPVPPPQRGKGSGLDAWMSYAAACGHPVLDGVSRDQVIEALATAGVRVE